MGLVFESASVSVRVQASTHLLQERNVTTSLLVVRRVLVIDIKSIKTIILQQLDRAGYKGSS